MTKPVGWLILMTTLLLQASLDTKSMIQVQWLIVHESLYWRRAELQASGKEVVALAGAGQLLSDAGHSFCNIIKMM